MPPIRLSRDEISSLRKIVERPQPTAEIPEDHAAKLVNCGLARREFMLIYATQLGQIEILRQRFRGISLPDKIVLDKRTTKGSLLFSGRAR